MRRIKLITLSLGLVLLSTLVFVGAANAQGFKSGDTITVAKTETVDSMLFAAGNNIDIAGTVNGDVYCAGSTVNISGTVKGDVFCGGATITIGGTVEGSVRLVGQSITINGQVGHNASVGARDLTIGGESVIGQDLLGGSDNITINGQVKRDVTAGSKNLTINGQVGRDIDGSLVDMTVGAGGKVAGNVNYISKNEITINGGGSIAGAINRTTPSEDRSVNTYAPIAFSVVAFIYMLAAFLIISVIVVALIPRILNEAATSAIKKPGKTAAIGLGIAVLAPVVIIGLAITFVGLPLALLVLVTYITVTMLSASFASYALGRRLIAGNKPYQAIIAGTSLLAVSYFVPIIGFVTLIATHVFGIGMIAIQSKKLFAR